MPRPYQIYQKPIMVPYVCIQCGVGGPPREWFVDLGFAVDHYFDVNTQAVYLCNECYHSMTLDISRLLQQFRMEHEKWDSGEKPTYSWMEKNYDIREPVPTGQVSGDAESEQFDATVASGSDRDDQDAEPNDPEPESSDSGDADSIDDSDSDATGFRVTFGSGELP